MTSLEGIYTTHTHIRAQAHTCCVLPGAGPSSCWGGWDKTAEAAFLSHRTAGGGRGHVGNDAGEESSVSCQAFA